NVVIFRPYRPGIAQRSPLFRYTTIRSYMRAAYGNAWLSGAPYLYVVVRQSLDFMGSQRHGCCPSPGLGLFRRIPAMNRVRCGMLLVISVFIAACGGNASLSPTAPSRTGGLSSGAVISGQVNGASLPATTRSTSDTLATASVLSAGTLATASVTVKIVGTNIS